MLLSCLESNIKSIRSVCADEKKYTNLGYTFEPWSNPDKHRSLVEAPDTRSIAGKIRIFPKFPKSAQLQTAVTFWLLNRFQSSWYLGCLARAETFENGIYNLRGYDPPTHRAVFIIPPPHGGLWGGNSPLTFWRWGSSPPTLLYGNPVLNERSTMFSAKIGRLFTPISEPLE